MPQGDRQLYRHRELAGRLEPVFFSGSLDACGDVNIMLLAQSVQEVPYKRRVLQTQLFVARLHLGPQHRTDDD